MSERIYTIPINDHFGKIDGCPLCSLFDMLEKNEIEIITGAAMMEPSVRIETNEKGFCAKHFDLMLKVGKKLPVALILQSHLEKITQDLSKTKPEKQQKYLSSMEGKCYVCGRIERNMNNIYDNLFYLYQTDDKFRELFLKQKYFCLPHYKKLLEYGQKYLARKEFEKFSSEIWRIESEYLQTLQGDVDWFCKKFDYRFSNESWKNSKDAVERAIYTISSVYPSGKNGISTVEG